MSASHKSKRRKSSLASGSSSSQPTPLEASPSQPKASIDQREWDSFSDKEKTDKINEITRYLLCASSKKIPVKREEITRAVMQGKRCFNICLQKAKQQLENEFGLTVVEKQRGSQKVFIVVNNLPAESREQIMQKSDDTMCDYVLLFIILSFMFTRPNRSIDEDYLQNSVLRMLGIEDGIEHPKFGLIKNKLDMFVEQCYLEKKKKNVGELTSFEYSWGPRAILEVDKKELLKIMSEVYDTESFDVWEKQYGDLIKDN